MRNVIQIDPWTYFWAALLVLTLPLNWLIAALSAAIFHELCHFAAIYVLGGKVRGIRVCAGGAVMVSDIPGEREELISAIAGPAGSFLLLGLCHIFPKLAICACIQGVFNLIPIYPMDGGRIFSCILHLICPSRADRIMQWTEFFLYIVVLLLAAAGMFLFSMGIFPLLTATLLIIKAILRKRPCKRSQIRVQ